MACALSPRPIQSRISCGRRRAARRPTGRPLKPAATFSSTREGGEEANGLERAGNAEAGNIVGYAAGDVAAVHVDSPCRHALKAGKDVDQRALAGSVRAEQAENLIPRKLEREVFERGKAPETDGDTVRSESRKTVCRAHRSVRLRHRAAIGAGPRLRHAPTERIIP